VDWATNPDILTEITNLENKKLGIKLDTSKEGSEVILIKNYAIEAIISEIKGGNLDAELLTEIEKQLNQNLFLVNEYFKKYSLSNLELLDLVNNGEVYEKRLNEFIRDTIEDDMEDSPS